MEKKELTIPYFVHEGDMARNERMIKKLIIALLIAVALIFASNAAWLFAWCGYDYVSSDSSNIEIDGKNGVANYIGNDGNIANGENRNQEKKSPSAN